VPRYGVGKLPHAHLRRLLGRLPTGRLLLGPGVGEDAAAIRLPGGRALVVATDPVTFAAERIGWYAVQINANDVATCGARPRWFSVCLLLPDGTAQPAERIFEDIARACGELDVAVVGGHTEVTAGLDRTIVVGQMMGLTKAGDVISSGGAKVGDVVVMTGAAAIEATAIIARERGVQLRRRCPAAVLRRARRFLFEPGISVVREALMAARAGASAMHDPTEGGVATGLWEMAVAGQKRLVVDTQAIPVLPETRRLCELVGVDPLRSIGSGSLLICLAPGRAARLVGRLKRARIAACCIGEVVGGKAGLFDRRGRAIQVSAVDEIAKL